MRREGPGGGPRIQSTRGWQSRREGVQFSSLTAKEVEGVAGKDEGREGKGENCHGERVRPCCHRRPIVGGGGSEDPG